MNLFGYLNKSNLYRDPRGSNKSEKELPLKLEQNFEAG